MTLVVALSISSMPRMVHSFLARLPVFQNHGGFTCLGRMSYENESEQHKEEVRAVKCIVPCNTTLL